MSDNNENKQPVFNKPTQRASPGIHAVHVNSAREMVKLHTLGRRPPAPTTSTMPNTSRPAPTPTASSMASSFPLTPSSTHYHLQHNSKISVPSDCKNPQCAHCGKVVIPAPQSSFPIQDVPSITVNNWNIYTIKKPILNSQELDSLESRYEFPLPEMIFGNNLVKLVNKPTGGSIEFNALDALDSLDDESHLKVSYHELWLESRRKRQAKSKIEKDISDLTENNDVVLKPYDWTYSPNYTGTVRNLEFKETDEDIPIEKLKRPDPILFFDESILFEDELADNGILMLSYKIRVMPSCLLLLVRFFLRIDNVIFRVRDTRVFIDFENDLVMREIKLQEFPYDDLLKKATMAKIGNDPKKFLRDSDWVSANIPVISKVVETNK